MKKSNSPSPGLRLLMCYARFFESLGLVFNLAGLGKLGLVPALLILGISLASAQTYTYTLASGSSSWNVPADWTSTPGGVPDSSSAIAKFAPTGTLTVALGTTPETVEEVMNSGSATTISGSGTGVLTLASSGSSTPAIYATSTLIIDAPIAGTQGITIGTSGSLNSGLVYFDTLASSPNTFTGGLTINTSTGSALVAYYTADIPSANTITIAAGNLDVGTTATSQTWANNIMVDASNGINSEGGVQTLSGSITGSGGVIYGGTTASGFDVTGTSNNYSGATTLVNTSFLFNGDSTVGLGQINFGTTAAANGVFVYNTGVTDDITTNSSASTRVVDFVNPTSVTGSTYINTNGNNVTWSNPIISSSSTGTNGLTKTGTGSLTLGSSNPGYADPITVAAESGVANLATTTTGGSLIGTGTTYAFGKGGALTVGAYGNLQLDAGATASNSTLNVVNFAELTFTLGSSPSLFTLSGAVTGTSLTAANLTLDLLAGNGVQAGTIYTLANYGSISGITYSDLTIDNNTGLALDTGYGTDGVNIGTNSLTVEFNAAPEPSSKMLLFLGVNVLLGIHYFRHRSLRS